MNSFSYQGYPRAVGFNPGSGLLAGLQSGPSAAQQAAYGQAMAGAAEMGMEAAAADQQLAGNVMKAESAQRLEDAQNKTQKDSNDSQYRIGKGNLGNRQSLFEMQMDFANAGRRKQQQASNQNTLLRGLYS